MSERNQYIQKVRTQLRPTTMSKTVDIKVPVPQFFSSVYYDIKAKALRHRRRSFAITTILVVVSVSAIGWLIFSSKQSAVVSAEDPTSLHSLTGSLTKGTPEYDTVLPAGKSIESLGGWTRVSPPERNPVFAYADLIGEAHITVSQQPLPPDFENDTAVQVQQLAMGYKANQKITVNNETVYIGTSSNGPQSVIFTKDKLLILIKSNMVVSNDHWAAYVAALK
ncbi:MAG: hypothetical protein JWN33_33 [Candidatus Saccharibacteria bacterium]|nr:hypothetical protein [Candidatus Saccharibacteria bacterium]